MEQVEKIMLPELSVLVVDSQPENITTLRKQVAELGLAFRSANSTAETLDQIEKQHPDLVLIDEALEGGNGFRLLEKIHSIDEYSYIPVVMMTSHLAVMSESKRVGKASFDENGYLGIETISKPINSRLFRGLIHFYRQLLATRKQVGSLHNHNDHLLEAKNEGVIALDDQGAIIFVNNSACRLLGAKPSELVGVYIESIFDKDHDSVVPQWSGSPIYVACNNQHIVQVERAHYWCANGETIPVKFAAVPVQQCGDVNIVIAFQQIRETQTVEASPAQIEAEAAKFSEAINRPLDVRQTEQLSLEEGLELFIQQASDLLVQQDENSGRKAFMILDIDHFRYIERQLGRVVAEAALEFVAKRINQLVGCSGDWLKFEGDRFGIVSSYANGDALARKLFSIFQEPIEVVGHELFMGVSISLCMFNQAVDDVESVLKSLVDVLFEIKDAGGGALRWVKGHSPSEHLVEIEAGTFLRDNKGQSGLEAENGIEKQQGTLASEWLS